MLRRLLDTQSQVQEHASDFFLICEDELREIRRLWLTERQDWEDSLPRIYTEVTGCAMEWDFNDVSTPGQLELGLLEQLAQRHNVPVQLVQKLLDAEWQYYGMRRRGLIHKTIEKIINQDWRTLEEIQSEIDQQQAVQATRNA
jgi:DNA sulfur modification protein DndC